MFSLFTVCLLVVGVVAHKAHKAKYVGSREGIPFGSVPLADIHWFVERNVRRNTDILVPRKSDKADGGLFEAIRDYGWRPDAPAIAELLPIGKYTAELAVKQREQQIKDWESSEDTRSIAAVMKAIWFPNGKAVVPQLAGVTGNRRGSSLPYILADKVKLLATQGKAKDFDPASFTLPVVVKEYANDNERDVDALTENEMDKLRGVKDLTWADRLFVARRILDRKGGNEAMLRRAFGDGNGQKAYRMLKLANMFPEVELEKRISMDRPTGEDARVYTPNGYLPAASFRWADIDKAIAEADTHTDKASRLAVVESYFRKVVEGRQATDKVKDKGQWKTLADTRAQAGSPMALIADVHLKDLSWDVVEAKYPQLFMANCVLSLADGESATKASGRKASAKA